MMRKNVSKVILVFIICCAFSFMVFAYQPPSLIKTEDHISNQKKVVSTGIHTDGVRRATGRPTAGTGCGKGYCNHITTFLNATPNKVAL